MAPLKPALPAERSAADRRLTELATVQPHGILAVVNPGTLTIEAISDNAAALLGIEAHDLCGVPFESLLDDPNAQAFLTALRERSFGRLNPTQLVLRGRGRRLRTEACAHRSESNPIVVEFEPTGSLAEAALPEDEYAIERLAGAPSLSALLSNAAHAVRRISGFNRVAIVAYGTDGRAEVVAESTVNGVALAPDRDSESIASSAGRMRATTRSRMFTVVDTAAPPAQLIGETPVDLSRAILRAAPVAELREMSLGGTRALARLSIVSCGRLWGAIECRHDQPRRLTYRKRGDCALIGQLLGWQLDSRFEQEKQRERCRLATLESQIAQTIARYDDIGTATIEAAPAIMELFDAQAIAIRAAGVLRQSPGAPAEGALVPALAAQLDARAENGIAWSNGAAGLVADASTQDMPAGVLYLQLGRDEFMLVLRGGSNERSWTHDDANAARRLGRLLRARGGSQDQPRAQHFTHVDLYLDARNSQTAALLQLHSDIAAALPSRSAIINVILDFVQRQTRAAGSVMETLTASEIVYEAATGMLSPYAGKRLPRAGSLSGISADLDAPLLCDDSQRDVEPVEREACERMGVASMVVVPITISETVKIVLKIVSPHRAAFGDDDIQTLKLAATNLSTALRATDEFTALAVAEREQRTYVEQLRALHAIATTTTSNRREQIDSALRLGLDQLGLDWAYLGVVDHVAQEFVIDNSVSRNGHLVAPAGTRTRLGETIVGNIATDKGVISSIDIQQLDVRPAFGGWSAYIAVPLFIDGVNYGSVGFTARTPRTQPFSEANVEFVAMAGELIASAVERGRGREQLVASERRYRALTEAIPEMVWVVDSAHRFVYVNARWTAYTGLTLEQSRTAGSTGFYETAQTAEIENRRSTTPPTEYECEVRLRRHDGMYRWHLMRSVPLMDSAGEWLVTATDIEDRKSAEALLTGTHDAALAATEAKSRFLATMSHEIRTPMNAVIGMTELLLLTQLSEEQREYLEIVRNSGQSLLRVLNDILDYSKIEAGKLELETVHFDLTGQIESVVELLRAQYQLKGVRLTTRIRPDVPAVVAGDPGRLRQILLNLVGNALKFTPEGGDVHIDVIAFVQDSDDVSIRFSVADTGIGIPAEIVERLFQPFSQGDESTTRRYGGTGLGLSICAQLVALMNGTIGVKSAPGSGSTFWFEVPLRVAKQSAKGHDGRKRGPVARSKPIVMRAEKILLVEDNEINTFLALKQLQRIGFIVSAVNNGRQAVDAVAREHFDLVFMDCHMPEMDGFAATREIRRLESGSARRLPIVAITADARTEDHQNCLRAGMDDYVSKPTTLESLRAVLDRWLPSPDRRQNSRSGSTRPTPPATLRVAKLLEIFGGDRAAVMTLLTAAAGAIKADFARIENCAVTHELSAVAEAAHRLKGTSASIRSQRLGDISDAVERAALSGDVSASLLSELREAVNTLIADVEKHGKLLGDIG